MNHERIVRALDHLFKAEHEIKCASDDSFNLSEFAVEIADINHRLRSLFAKDTLSTPSTNQSLPTFGGQCNYCGGIAKHYDPCPVLRASIART